ncbi:MAG TPA: AraC family transcriptional regulator [bacterium]|nr:AraC family transcriptional regulator [bacterium]HPN45575.1 AraC family transcriptional regulator [bacterium]
MKLQSRNISNESIHWTTSDEMLFTEGKKYSLRLPEEFPIDIKFYQFNIAHPIIPNYHDFYEISYFYSGQGIYQVGDTKFPIKPGAIVLIQSGQMHNVEADNNDSVKTASIYFYPELIYHPGAYTYEHNYLLPFIHPDLNKVMPFHETDLGLSFRDLFIEMNNELVNKPNFYQLSLKSRLCEILLIFLKKMNPITKPPSSGYPLNRINRLKKVFDYIGDEYSFAITLEQMAEKACMSPAYFCRYFKKVTGLSPNHYILRYRIDKAKELLITSDLSITEIAFKIGFNSSSYFDRIFQRFTTLSPSQFRQAYKTLPI